MDIFKKRTMTQAQTTTGRELTLTRLLKAPRELVFEVWTDPKHVALWWGPNGFTNTIHKMEVRPGGEWRLTMHGPDGKDFPNYIRFLEVVRPSKLVYKHAAEKEDEPGQFIVTVTFESQGTNTLLTMKSVFNTPEDLAFVVREYQADTGAIEHANRLEAYLAKMLQKSN
jgi:uncharacterized protein YndB with AHSA1/START domain